jgi:hypothetical protein
MSLASWVVAGMIPGVNREPLKKIAADPGHLWGSLRRTSARGKTRLAQRSVSGPASRYFHMVQCTTAHRRQDFECRFLAGRWVCWDLTSRAVLATLSHDETSELDSRSDPARRGNDHAPRRDSWIPISEQRHGAETYGRISRRDFKRATVAHIVWPGIGGTLPWMTRSCCPRATSHLPRQS